MDQFNEYINKHEAHRKNLPKDWVFNEFTVNESFVLINFKKLNNF
jgi:hypothetical protein